MSIATQAIPASTHPAGPEGLFGYVGFFNGRRHELYAKSKLDALEQFIAHFKPAKSKRHMVHCEVAERPDGSEVIHVATD